MIEATLEDLDVSCKDNQLLLKRIQGRRGRHLGEIDLARKDLEVLLLLYYRESDHIWECSVKVMDPLSVHHA